MPDLLDEIKDDIKQERFYRVWQEFGNYIIGAAIGVVAFTACFVGWNSYQSSKIEGYGNKLYQAYVDERSGKKDSSFEAYSKLSEDGTDSLAAISSLRKAEALLSGGKKDEALKLYSEISENNNAPVEVREFAEVMYLYNTNGDSPEYMEKLKKAANSEGPFKYSAKELLAFAELKSGNIESSKGLFEGLSKDVYTPVRMRERSNEMLNAINAQGVENKDNG